VPADLTAAEARPDMAFPRLAVLAEVVWTPREGKDFDDFMARLGPHLGRLQMLDVNYRRLGR
jgi:hexosaminidase